MAAADLSNQLSFLMDAGHLLRTTAPETSAFLMSQRSALLVNNDIPVSETQRQHVCSSCGHIMVAGQGALLRIENKKARHTKKRRSAATTTRKADEKLAKQKSISKVFTCSNCGRFTKSSLPPPVPIARKKTGQKISPGSVPALSSTAATASKLSANASSKKRAKNRKAGLQALLGQSQSLSTQSGPALSLSDFMKK